MILSHLSNKYTVVESPGLKWLKKKKKATFLLAQTEEKALWPRYRVPHSALPPLWTEQSDYSLMNLLKWLLLGGTGQVYNGGPRKTLTPRCELIIQMGYGEDLGIGGSSQAGCYITQQSATTSPQQLLSSSSSSV